MRCVIVLVLLSVAGFLIAAPVRTPPAVESKAESKSSTEAQVFSQQLFAALSQVAEVYVRPVSLDDLSWAAIRGLYEAVHQPVPAGLREEVTQAEAKQALIPLFARIREELGDQEALRGANGVLVSCKAVAKSLDPYCDVVIGAEQKRSVGLEGEATGIGVELAGAGGGPIPLKLVHLGGSAQRAGLRPGDELIALNGQAIEKLTAEQIDQLIMRGPPDPTDLRSTEPFKPDVQVTYRRPGLTDNKTAPLRQDRFTPEIVLGVRREDDNRWNYWIDADRHLAHVRLTSLMRGSSAELRYVLSTLERDGLQGLILDLRWCPGGYLDEAVDVARQFLGSGEIATIKARRAKDTVYRGNEQASEAKYPIVLLVNGDTMGGAELVAASLQDHGRAVVVGQRTRGKASVQSSLYLPVPGAGMKLTSGTFVRPNGHNLHRFPDSKASDDWGVLPDVEFRISAELDRQLARWWAEFSLRPTESTERLPLDTPNADPSQREAAEVLREKRAALTEIVRP